MRDSPSFNTDCFHTCDVHVKTIISEQKKTVLDIISISKAITRVSILINWPYNAHGTIIIDTNNIQISQSMIV